MVQDHLGHFDSPYLFTASIHRTLPQFLDILSVCKTGSLPNIIFEDQQSKARLESIYVFLNENVKVYYLQKTCCLQHLLFHYLLAFFPNSDAAMSKRHVQYINRRAELSENRKGENCSTAKPSYSWNISYRAPDFMPIHL